MIADQTGRLKRKEARPTASEIGNDLPGLDMKMVLQERARIKQGVSS